MGSIKVDSQKWLTERIGRKQTENNTRMSTISMIKVSECKDRENRAQRKIRIKISKFFSKLVERHNLIDWKGSAKEKHWKQPEKDTMWHVENQSYEW